MEEIRNSGKTPEDILFSYLGQESELKRTITYTFSLHPQLHFNFRDTDVG